MFQECSVLLTVSGGPDRGVAERAAQRHPQQAVPAERRVREGRPEALHAAQHGQQGRHWARYVRLLAAGMALV